LRDLREADPRLTIDEAIAFSRNRFGDVERLRWVEHGFDAESARAWTELGVLPNEARVWRSAGIGPGEARDQLRRSMHDRADDGTPRVPDGFETGWVAFGGRVSVSYGVTDPPGTRGRIAAEQDRESFGRDME
jgi:hypothetical protein